MTLQNMDNILRDLSIRHYKNVIQDWNRAYQRQKEVENRTKNQEPKSKT